MSHEVLEADSLSAGSPIRVKVTMEREDVDEDTSFTSVAPFFPGSKTENWWIVVGDFKTRQVRLHVAVVQ